MREKTIQFLVTRQKKHNFGPDGAASVTLNDTNKDIVSGKRYCDENDITYA